MPRPYPPAFRRQALDLIASGRTVRDVAASLQIAESCLRNWLAQADTDEGKREGLTSEERKELAALRRDKRRLEIENEILRRAAAYFARENVLPNDLPGRRLLGPLVRLGWPSSYGSVAVDQ
jgi:transposase